MDMIFLFNSILLGVGLSMDAFSVSLANGLNKPPIPLRRACAIAGMFALLQFLMPLFGWICVHALVERLAIFQRFVPWVAFFLLAFIGGSMLREGLHHEQPTPVIGTLALLLQGIATSIDALSVGFTIASYDLTAALTVALVVAVVTLILCLLALWLGRIVGTHLSGEASILGGVILIAVGIRICCIGVH